MPKFIHDFRLIRNQALNKDYFVLHLECPVALPGILPGQFAEVRVDGSPESYLRRPFSIYETDYTANTLSLLIKILGKGTHKLSQLEAGAVLNLVYPLGNTFTLRDSGKALLVGGGVGIAPMLMLAANLRKAGCATDVLIGGRTAEDIIEPEKYTPFGQVFITTDDGSMGEKGLVTEHSVFRRSEFGYDFIYTCGPDPMMKAVGRIAASKGIPCEASLENLMACGIGACLCCVVETLDGNMASCVDGPVFNTARLKGWN